MAVKKKKKLTKFQKSLLTNILTLGGLTLGGYFIYTNIKSDKGNKIAQSELKQWLIDNNISNSIVEYTDGLAEKICGANIMVYPGYVAIIKTFNDDELRQLNQYWDFFHRGGVCDDLSLKNTLIDEWGNYYENVEIFLDNKGY